MIGDDELKAWFFAEIFPLEPALTRFIRRNWRNEADVADLKQDIFAKVYSAAREAAPLHAKAFLFVAARNHLINSARHLKIVPIDYVSDLESQSLAFDLITPERHASAREELKRLQQGLDLLPPRCREAVVLRKIEGLSTREAAQQLGVGIDTIERQLVLGMRALADFMTGGSGKIRRSASKVRSRKRLKP